MGSLAPKQLRFDSSSLSSEAGASGDSKKTELPIDAGSFMSTESGKIVTPANGSTHKDRVATSEAESPSVLQPPPGAGMQCNSSDIGVQVTEEDLLLAPP